MSTKKKIYKPRAISGFPEWLPEIRAVEQQWMDHIRRVFESYGYTNIETPVVEELDVLLAKGETDKEIYTLTRLQADPRDKTDARLGLHFDQTVPFARYTAQHFNSLDFPFKRYQMQKVWRGERPQAGRMREFYQCDIDVVNPDNIPIYFDAEMPAVMWEILSTLPGMENEKIQIRISNRKILIGLLEHLSITDTAPITRVVDKIDKIGHDGVFKNLTQDCKLTEEQAQTILDLVTTDKDPADIIDRNDTMAQGIAALCAVMDQLKHLPDGAVKADLSIIRGFDYYTGTVYETVFVDKPEYGSICSGGRYDDLAGSYINRHLPGVGMSIGLSRLFSRLLADKKLPIGRKSPTDILVTLPRNTNYRAQANEIARTLRGRGFNVETYHADQKIQKQLGYAEKKGIKYVWFTPSEEGQSHEIKNMVTREQTQADPETWTKE